ncbi:putative chloroplast enhancing stress tolerance protein [Helianthus annuus]|nr:putative chloroplast enhancing stress tolerance protein [Helianthus annuus]
MFYINMLITTLNHAIHILISGSSSHIYKRIICSSFYTKKLLRIKCSAVMATEEKEIQISVDPVSMKEVVEYPCFGSPKPQTTNEPLPSLPKKNKFLSTSLPNSACSSPRGVIPKSKLKDHDKALEASLAHEHSVALSRLIWLREKSMQRSKSCGEGRPSGQYDEFDICLTSTKTRTTSASADSTPRGQTTSNGEYKRIIESKKRNDEDFKCGALCLFLPGFGKGKPVRSRRDELEELGHVISHRVSLEKFECGSWRSSGVLNRGSDFSSNHFFDLPLELIQMSGNDANLPVSSAFVFDKDVKGVLTVTGGGEKKPNDGRHVRFSTSSPTTSPSCITPRMRKARDEFNSFLEAQSA